MLVLAWQAAPRAQSLPSGFQESVVFSGLVQPTAIRFAADGRVFVVEKRGVIKVFDSLSDTTPTVFADLNANVYNFWDRGLLGLELDPNFPNAPYVYVLYTYDFDPNSPLQKPRWGTAGVYDDPCPSPPGPTTDGCVVTARLSRLQAAGNVMTGTEQVLAEGWCQQYPSHSIGALAFGVDGALYVGGGDGASFEAVDYGQFGAPRNPCGDPPSGLGGVQTAPTAQGGALRSQDLRTSGDPVNLNGSILRLDPATGNALPDNPLFGDSDTNARRIVAQGLRNPFRMTFRPGTTDLWIGDVGWGEYEEINRVSLGTAFVPNLGWPCYEGAGRQGGYDGANLSVCEALYTETSAVLSPVFAYHHVDKIVAGETCPVGSSSITGLAFYETGNYPDAYDGALFFADFSRNCIWVMLPGSDGLPDPSRRASMVTGAVNPVDLQIGPNGDLFYVSLGGTVRRVTYASGNQTPTARIQATPSTGGAPLTVSFDGRGSTDPDSGDRLTYSWDFNGDGQFADSTLDCCPTYTYTTPSTYTASLRVTDRAGATNTGSATITANNTAPTATITAPLATATWAVGQTFQFSGSATDQQDGTLPASALSWSLIMHHCPSNCHAHSLSNFPGVASGSFVAPDHEYPSHLELRLTATDSRGLQDTKSVLLYPRTVNLSFQTLPVKLKLSVNATAVKAPFTKTVIVGSKNSMSAISPQNVGGTTYEFVSWSDGGAQTHDIQADSSPATYTATFRKIARK
jgi:glucose/arabinose dehydrogenase